MSLFRKNPNEVAYAEGRKHWTDVIKNTGASDLLIWKHPEEDFNTNSTLIVMPGETALFVNEGRISEIFDNGTYKLATKNYPFISRLQNAFTGGIGTFHCVVYFVRGTHSQEIRWGTDSPIQVRDRVLGVTTKLKARGSYKVQVENVVFFLEKLLGGSNSSSLQMEELNRFFKHEIQSHIRSAIAKAVGETEKELVGISSRLDEIAATIQPELQNVFEEYGLRCVKFSISAIDIEEDQLRKQYDEIEMNAIAKVKNAQAERTVIDTLGENWEKQRMMDIFENAAKNNNGVSSLGVGLGTSAAFGNTFSSLMQQMTAKADGNYDYVLALESLKKLLDAGLIEQSDYDAKKAEILRRL